ncbi:transposase [Streptomyces luteolus]|uniref:transposase n=1 Tax=Streptomyces luteolus TaxID=3043615 RepID=UPI0038D0B236
MAEQYRRTTRIRPTNRWSSTPTPAWSWWSADLLPGNRNDRRAWAESSAKAAVDHTTTIADGGYPGTGLVIPHRRAKGQAELPDWKQQHNRTHKRVRARVEHTFARMKGWKIPRDCRHKATACTTPCTASPACVTSRSPAERTTPATASSHSTRPTMTYGTTLAALHGLGWEPQVRDHSPAFTTTKACRPTSCAKQNRAPRLDHAEQMGLRDARLRNSRRPSDTRQTSSPPKSGTSCVRTGLRTSTF